MSLTRAILRLAAPLPDLEKYDRFLFLGPHPDDIEIGAGATAAKLASHGKKIAFLICTDGRFGLANAPAGTTPEELIGIRQAEARASARVLGVEDVRFLGLSDGGFYDREALLSGMAAAVGEFSPQVIFAPDPDVDSECHPDHRNVAECARRLAFCAPFPHIMEELGSRAAPVEALAYYMTARPNRFVGTRGYRDAQRQALFGSHVSQFPPTAPETRSIGLYLRLRDAEYGLRSGKGHAEGFRVLGVTQMHCLPEAGL